MLYPRFFESRNTFIIKVDENFYPSEGITKYLIGHRNFSGSTASGFCYCHLVNYYVEYITLGAESQVIYVVYCNVNNFVINLGITSFLTSRFVGAAEILLPKCC